MAKDLPEGTFTLAGVTINSTTTDGRVHAVLGGRNSELDVKPSKPVSMPTTEPTEAQRSHALENLIYVLAGDEIHHHKNGKASAREIMTLAQKIDKDHNVDFDLSKDNPYIVFSEKGANGKKHEAILLNPKFEEAIRQSAVNLGKLDAVHNFDTNYFGNPNKSLPTSSKSPEQNR